VKERISQGIPSLFNDHPPTNSSESHLPTLESSKTPAKPTSKTYPIRHQGPFIPDQTENKKRYSQSYNQPLMNPGYPNNTLTPLFQKTPSIKELKQARETVQQKEHKDLYPPNSGYPSDG
jgi:hypothetical protein